MALGRVVIVSLLLGGCYPSFGEMITTDYRARVRRVQGPAQGNACRPVVRERADWGDGIDFVYEASGCTPAPILYDCNEITRYGRRGRDANCQPVLSAATD